MSPTPSDQAPFDGSPRCTHAPMRVFAVAAIVAVVALALRLPVCGESLWVDELHSTWSVWDGWEHVSPRARLGNQTPYYFWFLWTWHQVAGDSELALRLSSVICSALACSALTCLVACQGRPLTLALMAGLLLALDRNSIFFGTELRPYAAVVLGTVGLMYLLSKVLCSPRRRPSIMRTLGIASCVAILFLLHYTSVMTTLTLVVVSTAFAKATNRGPLGQQPLRNQPLGQPSGDRKAACSKTSAGSIGLAPLAWIALLGLLVLLAVAIANEVSHVNQIWDRRSNWVSFATPAIRSEQIASPTGMLAAASEMGSMWDWTAMVWVPLGAMVAAMAIGAWFQRPGDRRFDWVGFRCSVGPLLVTCLLVTIVAFIASSSGVLAIWHRRYLVGLMPMMALLGAELWFAATCALWHLIGGRRLDTSPASEASPVSGASASGASDNEPTGRRKMNAVPRAACVFALVMSVGAFTFSQGTGQKIVQGDFRWVHRGEDWRGAIAQVQRQQQLESQPSRDQDVLIYAGLIESTMWDRAKQQNDPEQNDAEKPQDAERRKRFEDYLCCPANNIYALHSARPIARVVLQVPDRGHNDRTIIARVPAAQVKRAIAGSSVASHVNVTGYGRVSVIRLQAATATPTP